MKKLSRHVIDDEGVEWYYCYIDHYGSPDWNHVDQVKITDQLACSRYDLGWVYVVFDHDSNCSKIPERLHSVIDIKGQLITITDNSISEGHEYAPSFYRVATMQECIDAGVKGYVDE